MANSAARTYLIIWAWLAGLMLLGVLLSALPISKLSIVFIVLALSSVKAVLVGLYYMHLSIDRKMLALIALFPVVLIALAVGVLYSSQLVRM